MCWHNSEHIQENKYCVKFMMRHYATMWHPNHKPCISFIIVSQSFQFFIFLSPGIHVKPIDKFLSSVYHCHSRVLYKRNEIDCTERGSLGTHYWATLHAIQTETRIHACIPIPEHNFTCLDISKQSLKCELFLSWLVHTGGYHYQCT